MTDYAASSNMVAKEYGVLNPGFRLSQVNFALLSESLSKVKPMDEMSHKFQQSVQFRRLEVVINQILQSANVQSNHLNGDYIRTLIKSLRDYSKNRPTNVQYSGLKSDYLRALKRKDQAEEELEYPSPQEVQRQIDAGIPQFASLKELIKTSTAATETFDLVYQGEQNFLAMKEFLQDTFKIQSLTCSCFARLFPEAKQELKNVAPPVDFLGQLAASEVLIPAEEMTYNESLHQLLDSVNGKTLEIFERSIEDFQQLSKITAALRRRYCNVTKEDKIAFRTIISDGKTYGMNESQSFKSWIHDVMLVLFGLFNDEIDSNFPRIKCSVFPRILVQFQDSKLFCSSFSSGIITAIFCPSQSRSTL